MSGGSRIGVCEIEIRLLFMARECVKSRSMVKCVLDVKYESVLMLVWQYFDYNLLLSTIKQLMQPLSGYGLI